MRYGCKWAAGLILTLAGAAQAGELKQISADPYSNSSSQHRTELEPDAFAYGSTVVASFQVGRFMGGGSSNIGWSTSRDGGNTWTVGFLPHTTKYAEGPYDRISDPSVAYDLAHDTWMISTLPIFNEATPNNPGVAVSLSTDGGASWGDLLPISARGANDKNWTVCDNSPVSRYFGHCYTEWDDEQGRVLMSTSDDGGHTWTAGKFTADQVRGLGGQPLVQPNGTVIVPIWEWEDSIHVFRSTDGGESWSHSTLVSSAFHHKAAGNLRAPALPAARLDSEGMLYLVWSDCRFQPGCKANDLVMMTSPDGLRWSDVERIPIDPVGSGVDHLTSGLGVDPASSGNRAALAVTYFYYPKADCTTETCALRVGFISSRTGGATWIRSPDLAGPMKITWLPNTSGGLMYGDYLAVPILNHKAFPIFAVAQAPKDGIFDLGMYTVGAGLNLGVSDED